MADILIGNWPVTSAKWKSWIRCTPIPARDPGFQLLRRPIPNVSIRRRRWVDQVRKTFQVLRRRSIPDASGVLSSQPDGSLQLRPNGTSGTFEQCLVNPTTVVFAYRWDEKDVMNVYARVDL